MRFSASAVLMWCLVAGCRPGGGPVEQRSAALSIDGEKAAHGIRPDEPIDRPDEPRYPSSASESSGSGSPMRPLPTVQFEPPDLTSSVGASSIRVDVYNLGDAVGADVLSAVANQIHLYEWPGGREVAVTTTGHDVDGPKYGMDGYKRNESAYVSVQPVTPLTDQWYIVKLLSLPSRVTAPTSKAHLMLPDGTMGARFAPGSHPVVAGLRICDKGQGNAIAMLDFSERVNYVPGAATVDLVGGNSNYCTPDPSIATVGTSQSIRFLCGGLPPAGSHLKISVPATVTSPSGGSLEVPGKGRGDVVSQISADGMQVWGTGCTFSRPF